MASKLKNFIIVDDDKLVNVFCSMLIKKNFAESKVTTFEQPELCLDYLNSLEFHEEKGGNVVLFLDINMPTMSGWEFLESFEGLDEKIKNSITIFILSSSVDARDMEKAESNPLVRGYLTKPLAKEKLFSIFNVVR